MKVVVTGATGLVGANVCRQLLDRGESVRALYRTGSRPLDGLDLETVVADVRDRDSLDRAFRGADAVIHLAALISIDGDADGAVTGTNVEGVANVVDACLSEGVERLVHMSSFHAFRQAPFDEPLTEDRPQVGSDGYAYDRSKAAGEREVDRGVAEGLHAVILNPTAIIGPNDYGPSLMGAAMLDMYHGRTPALTPGGSDWVDVRDVAGAAIAGLTAGRAGDRHLLSGHWASVTDFAALVAEVTGTRAPILTIPAGVLRATLPFVQGWARLSGGTPLYTRQSLDALVASSRDVRHQRATEVLGFNARPLRSTVEDAFAWYERAGMLEPDFESVGV